MNNTTRNTKEAVETLADASRVVVANVFAMNVEVQKLEKQGYRVTSRYSHRVDLNLKGGLQRHKSVVVR